MGRLSDLWSEKDAGLVVVVLLVGLFSAPFAVHVLEHNGAVQSNQPVEATVLSTSIDHKVVDDEDKYRPVVEYRYTVDGRTYTQDNVFPGSFGRWRDSRGWAERIAGAYREGQTVEARYDPGDPGQAYVRNDGWPGEWVVTVADALLLLAAGGWLVRQGFKRRKQRTLMQDTPTEDVESLSVGPSELKGTAEVADESLPAPFTDEDCVVATWTVEEYDTSGDDSNWETVDEGTDFVPFLLDDGTGAVRVEPHEETVFEFEDDDETTVRVDAGDDPPSPVAAFLERDGGTGPAMSDGGDAVISIGDGPSDGDRKYTQNLIRPGETTYVFGTVQPRTESVGTENPDQVVVRKVPDGDARQEPLFLIGDEPESEMIAERRWALWRVPVGVVFVVGGLGLVLGIVAPFLGIGLPAY